MAIIKLTPEEFLKKQKEAPVLDVRSPAEYLHAHIPGAYSFPLFSDAERALVGTSYKQQSKQAAIKLGLDFFGLKMRRMVEEAEAIRKQYLPDSSEHAVADKPSLLVHCWRGGMRSAGVAWLLDLYGFQVYTLEGGYKKFRKWVLDQFEKKYSFRLLGGYTGSGKTDLLMSLQKNGETIIDLEALANHKGSAFGNLGMPIQPSQEHFENRLALLLHETIPVSISDAKQKAIWVEDESQRIGDINIPITIWNNMRKEQLFFLDIPFEERLNYIVANYGHHEKERLVNAVIRIKKRLGGLDTKEAVNALIENRVSDCFRILLTYYDRWYWKGVQKRENYETLLHRIPCETVSEINVEKLLS